MALPSMLELDALSSKGIVMQRSSKIGRSAVNTRCLYADWGMRFRNPCRSEVTEKDSRGDARNR